MPLVGSMSSSLPPVGPSSMRSAEAESENRNGSLQDSEFRKDGVDEARGVGAEIDDAGLQAGQDVGAAAELPDAEDLDFDGAEVRFETSSEKRLSTSYNGWAWVSAKVSLSV